MDSIVGAAGLSPSVFAGPALVTLAYIVVYYGFMIRVSRTRFRLHAEYRSRGEKFDRYFSQDRQMLAVDRTQLNMLEHMPVFLTLMWLHAFLVSSGEAAILGGIYTGSRSFYPLLLKGRIGRDIPARILLVTVVGYVILLILGVRIVMSIL